MKARPKILLAEDDEGWRELVGSWLKASGYTIKALDNGLGVIPLARQFQPDCFILDHDLGDTTGHEVCAAIKSSSEFESTPVIILTAHVEAFPKVVAHHPPDQFVAKTPNSDELLLVLGALLPEEHEP